MVSGEIKDQIKKVLRLMKLPQVDVMLEHPADQGNGDYSTNVAMLLAKEANKKPTELAEKIADRLKKELPKTVARIEVAGPGFINFWLSEQFLLTEVEAVIDLGDEYGIGVAGKGKRIMVEFTDPNPFKEFHIGHLYSNIVGESLARLFQASGAMVKRANYQGDVGVHVAKSIWGLMKMANRMPKDSVSLAWKAEFLGKTYSLGDTAYEKDKKAKKEIDDLNEKIYALSPDVKDIYEKGRQWSLDYFETIYKRLGTKFDFYYFEREAGKIGLDAVKKGLKKGVFKESKGAVIFEGEKHGLHTRVFINSQGLPTYEAKDLGLAPTKYKDFTYDLSIIVTGNEVDEYFKVVLKALSLLELKLAQKTKHISHGMVKLPTGKMSSRTGKIITGEWLLDEAKKRVLEIVRESVNVEKGKQEEVAEVVGLGAVKYALLKSGVGKDIAFDFDESVNFEGDSGPYLQYTYARAISVLRKAKVESLGLKNMTDLMLNDEERYILRYLYRFPKVVSDAGEQYAPNLVCHYLYELAQRYNSFYSKHGILKAKGNKRDLRIALTASVAQVLKNGLDLLGIETPEKM